MFIQSVEKRDGLYHYTIVGLDGKACTMECWHPEGMTEVEREREALEYAKRLFGGDRDFNCPYHGR